MKKLKLLLSGFALFLAIGTAFATRPPACDCTFAVQYYFNGTTYVLAGDYGFDYVCLNFSGVCTYYQPDPIFQPNNYQPCRLGRYWSPN